MHTLMAACYDTPTNTMLNTIPHPHDSPSNSLSGTSSPAPAVCCSAPTPPSTSRNNTATTAVMRMAASVAAAALLPPPSGTPASYICCQVTAQDCFTSTFAEVAGKPQTPWQLLVLMKWSLPAAGSLCTHQHETRRVPGAGGIAQHCMMQWVSQQGTAPGSNHTMPYLNSLSTANIFHW